MDNDAGLSSNMKDVVLGDIVELITNKVNASEVSFNNYISTDNMLPNCGGVTHASSLPSASKFNAFSETDTLFSNIRTYFRKVWFAGFSGGASPDVLIFRSKNDSFINPHFLYYLISNKTFIDYTDLTSKGAKMPRGDKDAIAKFPVKLPSINEQKSIVSVLGALDEKIENNRRMNETLEEMARAIFKSWFVDFDPVHAKAAGNAPAHMDAETAALFPSSFGDDGLPVGWETKELGSLAQVLNGYAFKSSDYVKKGLFVLRTKNFGDARSAERLADDVYLPEKFAENYQKYLCGPFDFHVVMVAANLGKTSYIFPHMLPALRNQNMWCFRPAKGFPFRFFLNLSIEDKITHVIGWGSGSARDFFKKADFVKHKITICENSILNQFEKTAASLYKKIAANHHQNETLAELRDTLLPKLMSGEIRVKDAESEMEAAV